MMHIKIDSRQLQGLFKEDMNTFVKDLDTAINNAATIVESGAKTYAGRQRIKNTGMLISSLQKRRVGFLRYVVGTHLDYAELQEEGATMTYAELARHLQKIKGEQTESKGVITFAGMVNWKARPYLKPAFEEQVIHLTKTVKRLTKRK